MISWSFVFGWDYWKFGQIKKTPKTWAQGIILIEPQFALKCRNGSQSSKFSGGAYPGTPPSSDAPSTRRYPLPYPILSPRLKNSGSGPDTTLYMSIGHSRAPVPCYCRVSAEWLWGRWVDSIHMSSQIVIKLFCETVDLLDCKTDGNTC